MKRLCIGLPKGRFIQCSSAVLKNLGVDLEQAPRRCSWVVELDDINLCIKLLKVQDIPEFVYKGDLDFGITSDEWVYERGVSLKPLLDLQWCQTQVVLAMPASHRSKERDELFSKPLRIATPYPNLAKRYLSDLMPAVKIQHVSGSSEAFVPDICDGIVDCIETGTTLSENNLVVWKQLIDSSVRLFVCPGKEEVPYVNQIVSILRRNVRQPFAQVDLGATMLPPRHAAFSVPPLTDAL